jgi:2-polyprenyl-3-methyl-5-hydroxy-6-metoxy-1,4-benzoquinol methylase
MNEMNSNVKTSSPALCVLCGGTRSQLLGRNPDFPKSGIYRCPDCGYMWSRPEPTQAELQDVYRATYRTIRRESPTQDYLDFMDARAGAQYEFIAQTMSRDFAGLKILDIGCGAGSLLKVFEQHGAAVTGFEPDIAMAGAARERLSAAAHIENAMFVAKEWRGEFFDLICLSHVLEHVPNPVEFLAGLMRTARPGGFLFVEVPNETRQTVRTICKYEARGLMHLCFFNAGTLRKVMNGAGWTPLLDVTCGQDISTWLKTLRRNYSLGGRAIRKLGRILKKVGLAGAASPPVVLEKEWFTKKNPSGEYLRMVSQKPLQSKSSTL